MSQRTINRFAALLLTTLAGCGGCDACAPDRVADGGSSVVDARVVPQGSLLALDEIPIERLCEVFYSGYYRYAMAIVFGLVGAGVVVADFSDQCGGQFDERSLDYLSYSAEALVVECVPNAPTVFRTLGQRLQASVRAGRASYNGTRARQCLAEGRRFVDERGGVVNFFSEVVDASVPDTGFVDAACDGWLEGLVPTGGACDEHWECSANEFCKRTAQSCAGTCSGEVALGQPCDAFDRCADSGSCQNGRCAIDPTADAGTVVDAGGAGIDQFCGYSEDAGVEFECLGNLYCGADQRCHALPGAGQGCAAGRCGDGSVCGPGGQDGGVCGLPRPAGEACTGFPRACELCAPCTPQTSADGGPAYCRPLHASGEPCGPGQGNCLLGLVCVRAQCREPAARGEPCWVDIDDDNLGGNCFAAADYCADPERDGAGQCALRPVEGAPCRSLAQPGTQQGSCLGSYVFCKRSASAATDGVCTREPVVGEACGDRYDLSETCNDPNPVAVFLVSGSSCRLADGGIGTCQAGDQPLAAGDPCSYDSECPAGHFCHDLNSVCTVGAALGAVCGSDNNYTCLNGRCEYGGADAGYNSVCMPYLALGDVCGFASDDSCGPAARCASSSDAGFRCGPLAQAGESCDSDVDCATGDCSAGGVCIAGGECARDDCSGCSNTSALSMIVFFAGAFWLKPRKRSGGSGS